MTYTTKWLRLEALGVLLAVLGAYAITGGSWLVFIGLLLAPDLAMVGYLLGARAGAAAYNMRTSTSGRRFCCWPARAACRGGRCRRG
jgi:hypothetical protein